MLKHTFWFAFIDFCSIYKIVKSTHLAGEQVINTFDILCKDLDIQPFPFERKLEFSSGLRTAHWQVRKPVLCIFVLVV